MTAYKAKLKARTLPELADVVYDDDIAGLKGHDRARLSTDGNAVHDNTARATWAAQGLVAFAERTNMVEAGEDIQTALADLLADLRHLCDAVGVDWELADSKGCTMYNDEISGRY